MIEVEFVMRWGELVIGAILAETKQAKQLGSVLIDLIRPLLWVFITSLATYSRLDTASKY